MSRSWLLLASLLLLPGRNAAAQGTAVAPAEAPPAVLAPAVAPPAAPAPDGAASVEEPALQLGWSTRLEAYSSRWPGLESLRGPLQVTLTLVRHPERPLPDRTVRFRSAQAYLGSLPLGRLEATIRTPGGARRSTGTVDLIGPLAATLHAEFETELELSLPADELGWPGGACRGTLRIAGLELARLSAAHPWLALAGKLDLGVTLDGSADRPEITAELSGDGLRWRGEEVGALRGHWQHTAAGSSTLDAAWGPPRAELLQARLVLPLSFDLRRRTIRWRDSEQHELSLRSAELSDAQLRPLRLGPPTLRYRVQLRLEGKGTLDQGQLEGQAAGTLLDLAGRPTPFELRLDAGPAEQTVRGHFGAGFVALEATLAAPLAALRRSGRPTESVPLRGQVKLALPWVTVESLLPTAFAAPRGTLGGEVALAGTLGSPKLSGALGCAQTSVTLVGLNQRLQQVVLQARLQDDTLQLERFSARSGPGTITASGQLRLVPTPATPAPGKGLWRGWRLDSRLALATRRLPLVQELLPVALIDGSGRLELQAWAGRSEATLTLDASEVTLTDERLPAARPIPSNPGVRRRGAEGETGGMDSLFAGPGELHVVAELAGPLHLVGDGTDLTWQGRLVLDRRDQLVQVAGGFNALPGGRFSLFDNPFEVHDGSLTLLGGDLASPFVAGGDDQSGVGQASLRDPDRPPAAVPLDPVVELSAIGRAVDSFVRVKLRGPWRRPELTLDSSPPLPEYQIMTLLITGRADAVDERDGEVRRQVAALVERFHNPSLSRQLYDKLGVDKVGLGFGSSVSEPILSVGKQINRRLYVETVYHHNAPPDANGKEGRVEYRLSPRWTVDTAFGDAGEGGAGLFWKRMFGGPDVSGRRSELSGAPPSEVDRDGDGVPDLWDRCHLEAEDRDRHADADGCPDPDNDADGVLDAQDRAPDEAETLNGYQDDDGAPDSSPVVRAALSGRLAPLRFAPGSTTLTPADAAFLDAALRPLVGFAELRVEITGHGDDQGNEARNLAVSLRRARTVEQLLRRAGFGAERVGGRGLGFAQPESPARTDEARSRNRRVTLELLGAPPGPEAPPAG